MHWMSDAYEHLLEATIQHLEDLKSHGARFVSVMPETMAQLVATPRREIVGPSAPRSLNTAAAATISPTSSTEPPNVRSQTKPAPINQQKSEPADVGGCKDPGGQSKRSFHLCTSRLTLFNQKFWSHSAVRPLKVCWARPSELPGCEGSGRLIAEFHSCPPFILHIFCATKM